MSYIRIRTENAEVSIPSFPISNEIIIKIWQSVYISDSKHLQSYEWCHRSLTSQRGQLFEPVISLSSGSSISNGDISILFEEVYIYIYINGTEREDWKVVVYWKLKFDVAIQDRRELLKFLIILLQEEYDTSHVSYINMSTPAQILLHLF